MGGGNWGCSSLCESVRTGAAEMPAPGSGRGPPSSHTRREVYAFPTSGVITDRCAVSGLVHGA